MYFDAAPTDHSGQGLFVRLVKLASITAAFIVALHLVFSAAVAGYALLAYPKRIFDVRKFDRTIPATDLIGAYMENKVGTDTILFVGSSVTFGYDWAVSKVFTSSVDGPALNVGVLAFSVSSMYGQTLCELKKRRLRPAVIVLEIPTVNELSSLRLDSKPLVCDENAPAPGLYWLVVTRPLGLEWVSRFWDPYSSRRAEYVATPLALGKTADGYFATAERFDVVKPLFTERTAKLVAFANELAPSVYVFVAPIFPRGITDGGQNQTEVERQQSFAVALCKKLVGPKCIDTDWSAGNRELFSNVTHLSLQGHALYGRHMNEALRVR